MILLTFFLAMVVLMLGVFIFSGVLEYGRRDRMSPIAMRMNMLLAMSIPFSLEIALEILTKSKSLSLLLVFVLVPMSVILRQGVTGLLTLAELMLSSLMNAAMAAMMLGMLEPAVIGVLLSGMIVVLGSVAIAMVNQIDIKRSADG